MTEEDRWEKLRRIVREELDHRFPKKLKTQSKLKIGLSEKGWENISEEQRNAWKAAYPLVEIEKCLLVARAWCVSNPDKAPKSHFARFLNTWMRKTQNELASKQIPGNGKLKCRSCGSTNWTSLSNGRCQNCR